jgi:threonine dehydrogenase-like Zn-dependent dehydrogenase
MLEPNKIGWIEREEPALGPLDARLRPVAVMPCTTDVHSVWEGLVASLDKPLILGHEGVGQIIEIGSEVKDFKVGDTVIVASVDPNFRHVDSQAGVPEHCGGFLAGFNLASTDDGCFAESYIVRDVDANVALLPEGVTPEEGAFCSDMIATGFTAAMNADIRYGDTVVVLGIGPVGLMATKAAQLRGAGEIICVGSRPNCKEAAKFYGATKLIDYHDGDIVDQILDYTHGVRADRCITAGGPADVFLQSIELVREGGVCSNVAFYSNLYPDIVIPMSKYGGGLSNKKIIGACTVGGRYWMEQFGKLLKHKRVDVNPLMSHKFEGLEKCEDALLVMRDKPADLIKPIISFKY